MNERHILFVGGGTAGHIAPILAVMAAVQAEAKERKVKVRFSYVGLPGDLDSPIIKESKLDFAKYAVHSGKLHRRLTLDQGRQIVGLLRGLRQARRLLVELKPDVVFAKGGYSTIPAVRAAARLKIPIFCHETDVVLGLANRLVVRKAKTVFTTFPVSAYPGLSRSKAVEIGQPVRSMFYERLKGLPVLGKEKLDPKIPVITVIGGSQGAHRVNQLVASAWEDLLKDYQIVQISGALDYQELKKERTKLSKELKERLFLEQFLTNELPALFQHSAVVISRAGGTIAELAASRSATILLPLSTAAQNHQWANARVLQKKRAAIVLDERSTTSSELVKTIRRISKDGHEQTELRAAIGSFDHPEAAARMATYLLD